MLKRVLTMLLALILCLGLPCTALADSHRDTDPPRWQRWGYDSLAELLAEDDWTEEEYYAFISRDVAMELDYPVWKADYLAAHPDFAAQLLAEDAAKPLWSRWGYESQQEFEEDWEQSYADYLIDWKLEDRFLREWYTTRRMQEREALGGPAEGVGVMWMGEFVQFPDAQPATVNDRTMVPVRALMECAGATVDYQDNTVILKTAETEIRFRAGETGATLVKNGETSTVQMDVAPYVSQRRTYVPLRFFSQALGYDVLWDDAYKTAVILDPEAIIARLDQSFQTVNRILAARVMAPDVVLCADGSLSGKLTVFDSMHGDKTADISGSSEMLHSESGIDYRYRADFGAALDLLLTMIPNAEEEMDAETAAVLDLLRRPEMDMILNQTEGKLYLRYPAMNAVRAEFPADAWLELEYSDISEAMALFNGKSVGAWLYAMAKEYGGISIYSELLEAAGELAKWVGDDCFTAVTGGRELRLDLKKLSEDLDAELLEDLGSGNMLKAFELKLRVNDDGSLRLAGDFSLDSGIFGVSCSLEGYGKAGQATVKINCHVRNLLELTFTSEGSVRLSTQAPRTAPPAGAKIVSMEDLFNNY